MRIKNYRIEAAWGHLGLLFTLAAFVIWYVQDARRASRFIENTILIVPASVIALILIVSIIPQTIRIHRIEEGETHEPGWDGFGAWRKRYSDELHALLLMALLGGYVLSAPYIGFDVATFLFTTGGLVAIGERRWWLVLIFGVGLTIIGVGGMKALLSLAFPTMII